MTWLGAAKELLTVGGYGGLVGGGGRAGGAGGGGKYGEDGGCDGPSFVKSYV